MGFSDKEFRQLSTTKGKELLKLHMSKAMQERAFQLAIHGHDPKKDKVVGDFNKNIRKFQQEQYKKHSVRSKK